ncbi:hypothetical protein PVL29_015691 [Vitis rotundifolia]|uniref:Uncharacterized protein n=1 Tax=Vitis rotundifolia TaxID=103349 RepID=A0AA38ZDQ4_VITRO|nr:hypothetical protein PVL29_015691 [Vitis rotundifolia]
MRWRKKRKKKKKAGELREISGKEVREAEALKNGSISGGAGGDFGRDAGCFKAARELDQ